MSDYQQLPNNRVGDRYKTPVPATNQPEVPPLISKKFLYSYFEIPRTNRVRLYRCVLTEEVLNTMGMTKEQVMVIKTFDAQQSRILKQLLFSISVFFMSFGVQAQKDSIITNTVHGLALVVDTVYSTQAAPELSTALIPAFLETKYVLIIDGRAGSDQPKVISAKYFDYECNEIKSRNVLVFKQR